MLFKKRFSPNGPGKERLEWKSITGGFHCIRGFACGSNILSVRRQIVRAPRVYNMHEKYMHSFYSFMVMYQYVLCLAEASGFKRGMQE